MKWKNKNNESNGGTKIVYICITGFNKFPFKEAFFHKAATFVLQAHWHIQIIPKKPMPVAVVFVGSSSPSAAKLHHG